MLGVGKWILRSYDAWYTEGMRNRGLLCAFMLFGIVFFLPSGASAALTLTAGNSATTTPNVATSITGFQIVGPAASTTPVKLRATSGTLTLSSVSGVTMSGNNSGTVSLSGTVEKLNTALSSLTYTRGSTGTDTLEVALVNASEIFFNDNDHLYEFISGSFNWTAAKSAAEARSAYGAAGYLVTITSDAENEFVSDRLSGDGWIGAADSETEGTWKWMTGPETGTAFWQGTAGGSAIGGRFEAWAGGEPNQAGEEDCAETYVSSGTWNDFPCTASLGYVVEYGAPGTLPTVVAQNISIVTADVPAVVSLFPANGATTATSSANLLIRFTKTVTPQTGMILIKKSSDNTTVESIDVAGGQVTGGGTASILINPSITLEEGVQYYVIIPNTALRDGSSNYFDGIASSSSWTFTIVDSTGPNVSAISATAATTTASVLWTTNEVTSTKVVYSIGSTFASTTSTSDTSPRVLEHTKSVTGLVACTTYNYKVVSGDAAGNYATSSASAFTTLGCAGNSTPTSAVAAPVTVAATSTTSLTDSGRTMEVSTPANFTTATTTVVIQIRAQDSTPVLDSLGIPGSLSSAASVVFDVKALVNDTVELDSFDHPITITYTYTDEDIAGLDESTLSMYHYHDSAWEELDDCSVNAGANTITCNTPNFSIFGIFGSPTAGSSDSSSSSKGTSIQARVKNLTEMGMTAQADALKQEWHWLFPSAARASAGTSSAVAVRDLELGMTGEDVRMLQTLLNANGFPLASAGVGAPGSETDYFGTLTKAAVSAYQSANAVSPSVGYFGPLTRASMKAKAITGLWW